MNDPMRRKFLVIAALGSAAFVTACASPDNRNMSSLQGMKIMRKVHFERDGLTLAGTLYLPTDFNEKVRHKAVVVAGSLTSVKEQMAGTYAQKLADNGFVALAIDYAHYGESEGVPRQFESPAEKLADLKAAVSYLSSLSYVQSIGMVGICTSAGNAAYLAAEDPRVKALATVAAFLPDPALTEQMFGAPEIERRRVAGEAAKLRFEATGEQIMIPAYSTDDPSALNYNPKGSYDYYFNKARGGVPEWKNAFAVMSYGPWLKFDPLAKAPAIKIPTMVVHSDGSAFPNQAKKFHSLLAGQKELVWGDGNHYDYYDSAAQVDFAVKNVGDFLNKHLP